MNAKFKVLMVQKMSSILIIFDNLAQMDFTTTGQVENDAMLMETLQLQNGR